MIDLHTPKTNNDELEKTDNKKIDKSKIFLGYNLFTLQFLE